MSTKHKHDAVRSRNEKFVNKITTKICEETPSAHNPFIAQSKRLHGYELTDLMQQRSYTDVVFLLFLGELPTPEQSQLFEQLMIALSNPGVRHPATRAAMNVGIGKTNPMHILPVAMGIAGGDCMGGGNIDAIMRFLRKNQAKAPTDCVGIDSDARKTVNNKDTNADQYDAYHECLPGFGRLYGGRDEFAESIANILSELPGAGSALQFGCALAKALNKENASWLMPGVASAVFSDLGFQPRVGGPLFQLLLAPGMLAHGLEVANKPITAMPFVSDEDYIIER